MAIETYKEIELIELRQESRKHKNDIRRLTKELEATYTAYSHMACCEGYSIDYTRQAIDFQKKLIKN